MGEPGVGKTSHARLLGQRLQSRGWAVFEAGRGELPAGRIWIGAVEETFRAWDHSK